MDTPDPPELPTEPSDSGRQFAHRIKNLLSPAALYLDSVLLRETQLDERSREQLLAVQAVIEQVSSALEHPQDDLQARPLTQASANPPPAAATPQAPATSVTAAASLRLLLVDDDPMLLASLSRTLGFDQHAVQCAANAELGLKLAAKACADGQPFHAVITDLSMRGMDGQELARRLKAGGLTTHVILLTGWGSTAGGEQQLPDSVDQWLAKPPRLAALRQALQRVARHP